MKFTEILAQEVQKHLNNYYRISPISDINTKGRIFFRVKIWMDKKDKRNKNTLCFLELKEQQLLVYYTLLLDDYYGDLPPSENPDSVWDLGNPDWSPEIVAEYIKKIGDSFVPKHGVCLADKLKGIT